MNTIDSNVLQDLGITGPQPQVKKNELGQDAFLKLMLTQLQNQDPFKPMDDGQFLTQIAQFGTATGIGELKDSFGQVAGALYSNQALQASALVGRSVLVSGNTAKLAENGEIQGAIDVPANTDRVTITIHDAIGQPVKQLELGAQGKGLVDFTWDGRDQDGNRMPAGTYQISAGARVDGDMVAADSLVHAPVESVTLLSGGQGLTLSLGGVGDRDLTEIRKIM